MLLLMFIAAIDWKVTDTGVFQPLNPEENRIGDQGQLYVLNFDDAVIGHFAADGSKIGTIGGKGKGPGEFTYCTGLFFENGKLYVLDLLNQSVSIFDADGTYQKRFRTPARGLDLHRVAGGWVFGDWNSWSPEPGASLFMADEEMTETEKLIELPDRGVGEGAMVLNDNGQVTARYSPITKRPRLGVSPDGKTVYLTDLDAFEIQVIDVERAEVVREIDRKEPRIPFDVEWAEERMASSTSDDRGIKFEKMFPEYFPVIRDFRVLPDGTLMVNRWRGRPGDEDWALALDSQGNEVPLPFPWKVVERMVGIRDGYVYLTMYEVGDEEGWITRVTRAEAGAFVTAHPIDPDAESSRSISISN